MQTEPVNVPEGAPIRVTYRESADHLVEAREQAAPSRPFRWRLWPAILFGIVFITVVRAASERSYLGGIKWRDVVTGIGLVLFFAALLLLIQNGRAIRRPISRRLYRGSYRKQTGREESKVVCEFGDAALFISTEGGVATHYPWGAILKTIERPKGLLVYTGPEVFHWFPRNAFASEADYAAAVRLLRSKVADFQELN